MYYIKERSFRKLIVMQFLIVAIVLLGEIKCIIKAVKCNWAPIGKAEIIYTIGALTGVGAIVGYINIEDN